LPLTKNEEFNGIRKPGDFFKTLTIEQKNELIKQDSSYGKIICRCEQITEGEILHAIRSNPKATTIDAVKRRTRAGMGRCQGGFCQISVAEILAKELGTSFESVLKNGKDSELVIVRTK
jgi:glycerol-3-phosphate dehydrogenase